MEMKTILALLAALIWLLSATRKVPVVRPDEKPEDCLLFWERMLPGTSAQYDGYSEATFKYKNKSYDLVRTLALQSSYSCFAAMLTAIYVLVDAAS